MQPDPPARELLRQLATGNPVSGEALATQLGVTRAAVWKQIDALRAMGLPIEARSRAGYRMPWPMQLLQVPSIVSKLGTAAGAPVHLYWELDSTQDELARLLPDAPDLTVVLAERQTLGRGRRSHGWLSPPGLGITLSCLKHFAGGPARLSGLSIAMGVCVVQALTCAGVPGLQLKWPNDVVAAQGKLAGILIEVSGEYDGPSVVRVGVGMNVRLSPAVHGTLDQPAADLATLCGGTPPDRNELAARIIASLRIGLLRFEQEGLAPFAQDFAHMDWLAGKPLSVHGPQGMQSGIGRGIDARGALCVEIDGRIRSVYSDKVSVRIQPG
ncbi:MAG: biotin--[acetyl-CoA-carboxylase] ligase [Simplicispira suum]|uniref:biotin--[acetyl-CoA-carboxylase] ligase n=1 Tax=Simplicispira suum TaxID=2109915 RepID=UPI001C6C1AD8|nr:biotin--[acetyl-CoA-carboxylase] ligase [Simplicispira suum]MBW7832670.1 biotin--[acetyl-CoA-carboxylase] ligase [Simplicispira suum]